MTVELQTNTERDEDGDENVDDDKDDEDFDFSRKCAVVWLATNITAICLVVSSTAPHQPNQPTWDRVFDVRFDVTEFSGMQTQPR